MPSFPTSHYSKNLLKYFFRLLLQCCRTLRALGSFTWHFLGFRRAQPRALCCHPLLGFGLLLIPRFHLRAQAIFLFPQLGRELFTEVFSLKHLANLELALFACGVRATIGPFDRLFL